MKESLEENVRYLKLSDMTRVFHLFLRGLFIDILKYSVGYSTADISFITSQNAVTANLIVKEIWYVQIL